MIIGSTEISTQHVVMTRYIEVHVGLGLKPLIVSVKLVTRRHLVLAGQDQV